ncbi:sensor histidine kinase [Pedobacter sp. Hv1]|uniref:sensor histidine kinase n=1 Tax=Pedobacter sp. Hv1 TaxID=1740090 RepID=UPI000A6ACE23|nr:sensor histidine kinase [Pedobacter sp. Hv1]
MKFKLGWLSFGFLIFYAFQQVTWSIGNHLNNGDDIFYFLRGKAGLYYPFHLLVWLLCALVSYSLFYILFYRYKQKTIAIICYILIGIPLMIGIRYLMEEVILFAIKGKHNYSADMLIPLRYFIDNIYFTIYYSAFGIVFFFIQLNNFQQKMQNELIIRNRQAELSFLRSQINPHFLFNSLNNVYTLVYQGSEKALASISKLSELLRYMLYEEEERVALIKEVRYLQHYIDLQLMRYDFVPATKINISLPADCTLRIAPLTLIPFVENAFKHGNLRDENLPLIIDLRLNEENLLFNVSNKIGNFNKDHTGGIGSENVKKRLDLIYGDQHTLAIVDFNEEYSVKLTINLHE